MRHSFHRSDMQLDPEGLVRETHLVSAGGNGRPPELGGTSSLGFKPFRILLAASALFIFFLMLFVLYFPAGGDDDATGAVSGIYENLARMNEEIDVLAADLQGSKDDLGDRLDDISIELAELSRKLDAVAVGLGNEKRGQLAAGTRLHTVRKGENVFGIARHYGMPVKVLCDRNGITPSEIIQPGQTLVLQ